MTVEEMLQREPEFRYMMLGRLQQDCEYYLGYGLKNARVLWSHDEKKQIEMMKKLWDSFSPESKPEWLTWEQILEYERNMVFEGE